MSPCRCSLVALLALVFFACTVMGASPPGLSSNTTLLDASLVTNWLHREGWDLRGPVRSVDTRTIEFQFNPLAPNKPIEQPYDRPDVRRGVKAPVGLAFDEEGRLTQLNCEMIGWVHASPAELESDSDVRSFRPEWFTFTWSSKDSEVLADMTDAPRYRVVQLSGHTPAHLDRASAFLATGALCFLDERTYEAEERRSSCEHVFVASTPSPGLCSGLRRFLNAIQFSLTRPGEWSTGNWKALPPPGTRTGATADRSSCLCGA